MSETFVLCIGKLSTKTQEFGVVIVFPWS